MDSRCNSCIASTEDQGHLYCPLLERPVGRAWSQVDVDPPAKCPRRTDPELHRALRRLEDKIDE